MNKLKFLLESEILTEDTKKELVEAVEAMKEEMKADIEVEYAKKLNEQVEKMDAEAKALIMETVKAELEELREDVEHYRHLEVEYAEKLASFKDEYAKKLEEATVKLVSETVSEEIEELREDLKEAKKEDFGRRLFEAFSEEFMEYGFAGADKDLRDEMKEMKQRLAEAEEKADQLLNEKIKDELLSNLSGESRKVMETLLEGVSTDKLEEKYEASIEFVLKKDDKKLDESVEEEGDEKRLDESVDSESDDYLERLRVLMK